MIGRIKRFTIIIVLLLSLFGVADLFRPGYYSSHDGTGHVIRMEEFYRAFTDGQLPVRWSGRLYWGYGYPFFNFNYPSIYYLGVPLMAAGLSATDTMKTETIGFFVLSGILMFLYLRRKVSPLFALLGVILYLYAPYRMSNIYVRGSVAESMAFVFPPLLLWGAESLDRVRNIFWLALIFGLMGISHNISTLLLAGFFFGYLLILAVEKKAISYFVRGLIAFVLGLLMAAFFIVPALYEKRWTFLDLTIARDYPDHFVLPWQLVNPWWGYGGSVRGGTDGMSFSLGLVQAAMFFFALKYWRKSALLIFCLGAILTSVFFMFEPSKLFWDRLPLLPFVQFPWRFTLLAVPALAILGSIGASFWLRKRFVITLLIVAILSTSYMWFRNQTENVSPIAGDAIEGSTTWAHEQATRWLVPKPEQIPKNKVENAVYSVESWKTREHRYTISGFGKVTENTMYYPGWKVFVDGVEQEVDYGNGKINYSVGPGAHQVITRFTETPLRKTVDIVSLLTFAGVVLSLLFSYAVPKVFAKH